MTLNSSPASSFDSQVAWVTGASSGIGAALAAALLRSGAFVVLSGRRPAELDRVASIRPERALVLPFEATDYDSLAPVVERAWAYQGRIDLLVNNAGISQRSLAIDTTFDVYRRLIEVDYLAPVALTQRVLPRMVARRAGHIAVVSSIAGKAGTPPRTGYCGAKHAVVGYFEALRGEIETAYGIHVSVVLPGSVRTAIASNALSADGSKRGRSDANIENGIDAGVAADTILQGLIARRREIVVAEGMELAALQLRSRDPERLYDLVAQEGARLAALRDAQGPCADVDPADVRGAKLQAS